ncbi:MAG: aminoacyl-tRNA hydrolase [Clostridiaceae bacterium]|nr:aminoacyl-tRNA hydrolase [Clostridiaceae bacterium]
MWLIAGLGNPGTRYTYTWHNVGFMLLAKLAEEHNISLTKLQKGSLIGQGRIAGQRVILAAPQTFMNLSGESLRALADYYRVPYEHLLVIYDDADLPLGSMRLLAKGGAGTHNGMRSILLHLGTEEFPRLRIGIGPVPEHLDIHDHVLSKIQEPQRRILAKVAVPACAAIEMLLREGPEAAMNLYNRNGGKVVDVARPDGLERKTTDGGSASNSEESTGSILADNSVENSGVGAVVDNEK